MQGQNKHKDRAYELQDKEMYYTGKDKEKDKDKDQAFEDQDNDTGWIFMNNVNLFHRFIFCP